MLLWCGKKNQCSATCLLTAIRAATWGSFDELIVMTMIVVVSPEGNTCSVIKFGLHERFVNAESGDFITRTMMRAKINSLLVDS